MPVFTFKREHLKPGENLCEHCTAMCCRYFSVPIDTPTTRGELDNIRWFMLHGRVTVYVEDDVWYLCVYGDCKHILPDYRCGTYETRPQICREYSTNKCEYDDKGLHDKLFDTPEQIYEYMEALYPAKKKKAAKGPKGVRLPVVS
ncbi:MAG: YkgJ family cysteine cluster protein [Planctomycetes bacterium]|nr:YkgJ family cysteine cluster protein [Planctomycetota bacterium]